MNEHSTRVRDNKALVKSYRHLILNLICRKENSSSRFSMK